MGAAESKPEIGPHHQSIGGSEVSEIESNRYDGSFQSGHQSIPTSQRSRQPPVGGFLGTCCDTRVSLISSRGSNRSYNGGDLIVAANGDHIEAMKGGQRHLIPSHDALLRTMQSEQQPMYNIADNFSRDSRMQSVQSRGPHPLNPAFGAPGFAPASTYGAPSPSVISHGNTVPMGTMNSKAGGINATLQGHPDIGIMAAALAATVKKDQVKDLSDLDFINKMLIYLWPRCDKMVRGIIRDSVIPAIRASVPKLGDHIDLTVDLGRVPPTIGPINAFCDDDAQEEITLEIDINWDAELYVKVDAGVVKIVIDQLEVRARAVILMNPLINEAPLIGAMNVAFLNPPSIDMRIRVQISGIAVDLGSTLKGTISQTIIDMLVLPNRILVPIASFAQIPDMNDLHNPLPEGIVKLKIIECINLPAADLGIIGAGTSDPFIKMIIGGKTFKSGTQFSTKNPKWKKENSDTFFYFTDHQRVRLEVWDFDLGSGDDLLGSVTSLTIKDLAGDNWFDIELEEEFFKKGLEEQAKDSKRTRIKRMLKGKKAKENNHIVEEERLVLTQPPQMRLQAEFFSFSDHNRHIQPGADGLLAVKLRGVRRAKGHDSCAGLVCGVTVFGETRYTAPALPNYSVEFDPVLSGSKVDLQMVHKLSQLHHVGKCAEILELPEDKVRALIAGGHSGIWCHTFYYNTREFTGTVVFEMEEERAELNFDNIADAMDMKIEKHDLILGGYFIDVIIDLKAVIPDKDRQRR